MADIFNPSALELGTIASAIDSRMATTITAHDTLVAVEGIAVVAERKLRRSVRHFYRVSGWLREHARKDARREIKQARYWRRRLRDARELADAEIAARITPTQVAA